MVNLTKCFAEDGYKVILVTSFRDTWEYEVSPLVKRVVLEPEESKENVIIKNIKRIYGLRKVCKAEKADILISFMAEPNIRAIIAASGLRTKSIISVRADPQIEYQGKLGVMVKHFVLPLADGCVFQTAGAKTQFTKKLQEKSKIIYNVVRNEFFDVRRNKEPMYIITCGRLDKMKNHEMLINAYSMIKTEHTPKLMIYGEGSERENLESLINELGLGNDTELVGQSNEIESVLQNAKLFVLTSNSEGMPNALMEAMAAGVPCISTDCPPGAPRELFGEILKDYLVPVGDTLCLAEKMRMVLNTKNDIGTQFKNQAQLFRQEKVYAEWKNYVMEVMGDKKKK